MREPSAADSQVITAVLTELFFFSTAHGNVEIYITVCTCFVKSFFCPLSLPSQLALSPATRVTVPRSKHIFVIFKVFWKPFFLYFL